MLKLTGNKRNLIDQIKNNFKRVSLEEYRTLSKMNLDDLFSSIYYKDIASLFQNICNTNYIRSKYKDKRLSLKRKKIKAIDDVGVVSSNNENKEGSHINCLDTNRIIIYNEDFFKYDDKPISNNEKNDNKNVDSFQESLDNSSIVKLFEENFKNKFTLDYNALNKTFEITDDKHFPNNFNFPTSSNFELKHYIAGQIKIYSDFLYSYFPSNFSELDTQLIDFIFNNNQNVETFLNLVLWENYLNHIELNKSIDFSNILSAENEKNNGINKLKIMKRGKLLMNYIVEHIEKNHFYSNQFGIFNHENWKLIFHKIPFMTSRVFSHLSYVLNTIKKSSFKEVEYLDYKKSFIKTFLEILYEYLLKIINLKEKKILEGHENSDINLSINNYNHEYYDFEEFEINISSILIEILEITKNYDIRSVTEELIPNFYSLMSPNMKNTIFNYLKIDIKKDYDVTSENELNHIIFTKILNTIEFCLYADTTKLFILSEFFKLEDPVVTKRLIEIISENNLINFNNFDIQDVVELIKNCNEKCFELLKFLVTIENNQIIKSYSFNKSISAVCRFYENFKAFTKDNECNFENFFNEYFLKELNNNNVDESILLGIKLKRMFLTVLANYPAEDRLTLMKSLFYNISFDEFFTWVLPFITDLTYYIFEPDKRTNLIETFKQFLSKGVNIDLGNKLYFVYNEIAEDNINSKDDLRPKKSYYLYEENFLPQSSIKDGLIYLLFFFVVAKYFSSYLKTNSLKGKETNDKSFSNQINKYVNLKNLSSDFIDRLVDLLKNYEEKIKFLWNCYVHTLKKKNNEDELRYTKSVVNMLSEIKSFMNSQFYLEMLEVIVIDDERGYISKLLITFIVDNIDMLEKEDKKTSYIIKKIKDVMALLKTKFRDYIEKKIGDVMKERINKLLK